MSDRSRRTAIRRVLDRHEREDFITGRRTLNPRLSGVPVAQWRTMLPGHRRTILDSRVPLGTSPEAVALLLDTPCPATTPTPTGRPATTTARSTTPPAGPRRRGQGLSPASLAAHDSRPVPLSEPPTTATLAPPTATALPSSTRSVVLCSGRCGRYLDARGHRPRGRYCPECRPEPSRRPRRSRRQRETHVGLHGYV